MPDSFDFPSSCDHCESRRPAHHRDSVSAVGGRGLHSQPDRWRLRWVQAGGAGGPGRDDGPQGQRMILPAAAGRSASPNPPVCYRHAVRTCQILLPTNTLSNRWFVRGDWSERRHKSITINTETLGKEWPIQVLFCNLEWPNVINRLKENIVLLSNFSSIHGQRDYFR